MQITPAAAKHIERHQRRHDLHAQRPLQPRNQHPLRDLPARRTARTLRRQRRWPRSPPTTPGPATPTSGAAASLKLDEIPLPRNPRLRRTQVLEQQKEYRRKVRSELGYERGIARIRGSAALALGGRRRPRRLLDRRPRAAATSTGTSTPRVFGVTWVLVSFNLVMALAAVPAAMVARRVGPGRAAAVGLAIFAGAGLACGLSDSLETLIVARSIQALGGAARGHRGARAAAGRRSARSAAPPRSGRAPGRPAPPSARRSAASSPSSSPGSRSSCSRCRSRSSPRCRSSPSPAHEMATGMLEPEVRRRPAGRTCWANLALAMVSAAIAAALFLLVLLLIEGWRLSPIGAAIVVSVMPAGGAGSARGSAAGSPDARAPARRPARSSSAGGLAGLALLPKAEVVLTLPPQVLIGIGLSLVLSALTETALARARLAGDPRRLDDLRPPRRRRHRPAGADPGLHRRHRRAANDAIKPAPRSSSNPGRTAAEDRACRRRSPNTWKREERRRCRTLGHVFEPLPERRRRKGRSGPAARRTAGPAQSRAPPTPSAPLSARRPDRPAGAGADRPGEEGASCEPHVLEAGGCWSSAR